MDDLLTKSIDFGALFKGRLDYRATPELLDIAQETENERLLYDVSVKFAFDYFQDQQSITVIDLCAGSGLFAEKIIQTLPVKRLYCVDNDDFFLRKAKDKLLRYTEVDKCYFQADAAFYKCSEKVDLILMGSAYHHIEDELKVEFLNHATMNLKTNGLILINENFLPPYEENNLLAYRKSVFEFYSNLFEWLVQKETPENSIDILRQTAWFGYQKDYEYKVSKEVFYNHILSTKLKIICETGVWTINQNDSTEFGSYLIALKK